MRGQVSPGPVVHCWGGSLVLAPRAPEGLGRLWVAAAPSNRGTQPFPREMNPMLLPAPSVQPTPHQGSGPHLPGLNAPAYLLCSPEYGCSVLGRRTTSSCRSSFPGWVQSTYVILHEQSWVSGWLICHCHKGPCYLLREGQESD